VKERGNEGGISMQKRIRMRRKDKRVSRRGVQFKNGIALTQCPPGKLVLPK